MKRSILILIVVLSACIGSVIGSFFTLRLFGIADPAYTSISERQQSVFAGAGRYDTSYHMPRGLDFLSASKMVTPAVVHIRTSYGPGDFSVNPLESFFNIPTRSSGSGVIISDDGYIVTNYHVIEDASNIEIVLNNNRRYFGKLVGADPTTDLALIKIRATQLPFIRYGDSDRIVPGEWVLAVGNPFDLNSTVTAGIVSAKARNIGILRDRNNLQVESFIQTDAAVNPGNSGGALVNLKGELIGVNTAIATSSGSYQGYSFAIPVSLVEKVMDDLLEFGQVQRGLLGIQITDVTGTLAEELKLTTTQGVLINRVNESSAAEESGLQAGDVILAIDDHTVNSVSELQEWVARNRPGVRIMVTYLRDGNTYRVSTKLRNSEGNDKVSKRELKENLKGVEVENVPYKELNGLNLEGGVRVTNASGIWKSAGVRKNFIIAYIDKVPVDDYADLLRILDIKKGAILVEGYYPSGDRGVYAIDWK